MKVMKNKKNFLMIIAICILFVFAKPIYGKAESINANGNLSGMMGELLLMKQDYMYLEGEIKSLMEECR